MTAADRLERQCHIVDACPELDAAAYRLAQLAAESEPLDLWRLPIVIGACASVSRAQADAHEAWAAEASESDALLTRELRRLADRLSAVSDEAARTRALANDFAESESPDERVPFAAVPATPAQ